jgi:hypothetical protein
MHTNGIWFFIGLMFGGFILGTVFNVVRAIRIRIGTPPTEAEKAARLQRLENMSRAKKVGVAVGLTATGIGLIILFLFAYSIMLPTPEPNPVTGYYPVSAPMPQSIGMYMGIALLVLIFYLVTAIDFDDDDDEDGPAVGLRQALRLALLPVNLLQSLTMPLVIYASLYIGSRQIPLYQDMGGLHPAEFVGAVKAAMTIFMSLFIIGAISYLQGLVKREKEKPQEQIKAAVQAG